MLAIIGGVFYWFQWRPNKIRKACNLEAVLDAANNIRSDKRSENMTSIELTKETARLSEIYYLDCMRRWGLEK
jgi:hypothetical protein